MNNGKYTKSLSRTQLSSGTKYQNNGLILVSTLPRMELRDTRNLYLSVKSSSLPRICRPPAMPCQSLCLSVSLYLFVPQFACPSVLFVSTLIHSQYTRPEDFLPGCSILLLFPGKRDCRILYFIWNHSNLMEY